MAWRDRRKQGPAEAQTQAARLPSLGFAEPFVPQRWLLSSDGYPSQVPAVTGCRTTGGGGWTLQSRQLKSAVIFGLAAMSGFITGSGTRVILSGTDGRPHPSLGSRNCS